MKVKIRLLWDETDGISDHIEILVEKKQKKNKICGNGIFSLSSNAAIVTGPVESSFKSLFLLKFLYHF